MATVSNKTQKPLSVPLPGGKTLHLGPGRSGEIASKACEHAQLKKLVEAGEIEILGEGLRPSDGIRGARTGRPSMGHASGISGRRSGDR